MASEASDETGGRDGERPENAPEKPRSPAKQDRETRLAEALRANLRRRKAAANKEQD